MSTETIEQALAQALMDLNEIKKAHAEQKQLFRQLLEKVERFDMQAGQMKSKISPTDLRPLEALMKVYMEELQATIKEQSKSSKRILLFPEYNAREYYSVVLRWTLYIIIAYYSWNLMKYLIDHWSN